MKHTIQRAEIYARSEVEAILSAPRQPRDRVFLMMENRKIQPVWETFIQKGTASNAVRGGRGASWKRSQGYHIPIERAGAPGVPEAEVWRLRLEHAALVAAARPP